MRIWLALAITLLAVPAQARSVPMPASGPPGSYLLASDAAGRLIAGAYAIGPDTKLTVRVKPTGEHHFAHIDREVLPRRLTAAEILLVRRFDYAPDPRLESLKAGETISLTRRTFVAVFGAPPAPTIAGERAAETETLRIRITGIGTRDIGGLTVRQIAYQIDEPTPPISSRAGPQRVYFPDLDLDLAAAEAARLAKVERSDGFSSDDFTVLVLQRIEKDPAVARCLAERRGSADYRAAQEAYRNLADTHTAKHFPERGVGYVLDKGIKDVAPILKKTGVAACFPQPAR